MGRTAWGAQHGGRDLRKALMMHHAWGARGARSAWRGGAWHERHEGKALGCSATDAWNNCHCHRPAPNSTSLHFIRLSLWAGLWLLLSASAITAQ